MRPLPDGPLSDGVVLVTRAGCHLCAQGREVLSAVARETGRTVTEVDVDADPAVDDALRRALTDRVPVVLVDGRERDFGLLDADRLRSALAGRRWWARPGRRVR